MTTDTQHRSSEECCSSTYTYLFRCLFWFTSAAYVLGARSDVVDLISQAADGVEQPTQWVGWVRWDKWVRWGRWGSGSRRCHPRPRRRRGMQQCRKNTPFRTSPVICSADTIFRPRHRHVGEPTAPRSKERTSRPHPRAPLAYPQLSIPTFHIPRKTDPRFLT